MMRDLSTFKSERKNAGRTYEGPYETHQGDRTRFLDQLRNALYVSMIITYSQGMALLGRASNAYGYHLDLAAVARIWRGGCIIRAAMLEDLRAAFRSEPELSNLLLDSRLANEVQRRQADLRRVIRAAADWGLPVPGLMASLGYFDAYRSEWLPTNLTQAQRDYFGAHTYKRTDMEGTFHTQWVED